MTTRWLTFNSRLFLLRVCACNKKGSAKMKTRKRSRALVLVDCLFVFACFLCLFDWLSVCLFIFSCLLACLLACLNVCFVCFCFFSVGLSGSSVCVCLFDCVCLFPVLVWLIVCLFVHLFDCFFLFACLFECLLLFAFVFSVSLFSHLLFLSVFTWFLVYFVDYVQILAIG